MRPSLDRVSDGHGYGFRSEVGLGTRWGIEGHAFGAGGGLGDGIGDSYGEEMHPYGFGEDFIPDQPLPITNEEARRTERLFRCAGCIGGFECPIHGRRL